MPIKGPEASQSETVLDVFYGKLEDAKAQIDYETPRVQVIHGICIRRIENERNRVLETIETIRKIRAAFDRIGF